MNRARAWILVTGVAAFMLGLGLGLDWGAEKPDTPAKAASALPGAKIHGYTLGINGSRELASLGPCTIDPAAEALPLIVKPGQYCIQGQKYELIGGGARFYRLNDLSRYFIVDNGNL